MLNRYNTLYLEGTRNCNLSCKYCSTGSNNKKHFIDAPYHAIIDKILLPAYEIGVRLVSFSGGEFLLRKDAVKILKKSNSIGFKIGLASNGILLSDEKIKEIKDAIGDNLIISIGINSFDDNNKKTRNLDYEFTLRILERLENHKIRVNISVTIGDFNKLSFESTIKNINKFSLPYNRIPFVPRNFHCPELMFNKESLKNYFHPLLRKNFYGQASYTPFMLPPEIYNEISGQHLHKEQIPINPNIGCWVGAYFAINPEGEVSPCPMFLDHVSGGNVYKTPLKDILFKSDLFQKITDRKNLKGKCGNCKYTHTCGGCRVMAYYYSGDVYEEDPTCFLSDLCEEEIMEIEKETIKSFRNYARMAYFGKLYYPEK